MLVYFLLPFQVETGYLKHVFNIFKYLGYSTYSQPKLNWDVLWTHDYPFLELVDDLTKLKPHQKVRFNTVYFC